VPANLLYLTKQDCATHYPDWRQSLRAVAASSRLIFRSAPSRLFRYRRFGAQLGKYGVDKFCRRLSGYGTLYNGRLMPCCCKVVKDNDPAILLLGASVQGKDCRPALPRNWRLVWQRIVRMLRLPMATFSSETHVCRKCFGEIVTNVIRRWLLCVPMFFPQSKTRKPERLLKWTRRRCSVYQKQILEVRKIQCKVDLTEANCIVSGAAV